MTTAATSLRRLARSAVDLTTGSACAGCGGARSPACPTCLCGLAVPRLVRREGVPGLPVVATGGEYAGAARVLLLAHKERGRLGLARPLGAALAGAVREALRSTRWGAGTAAGVVLVPVPSRPGSTRRRGHDPVLRLARVAAVRLRAAGLDIEVGPVLRLRRRVLDQSGLDAAGRRDNLHGALGVPIGLQPLLRGRTVVLVDDVLTTGATLAEAARAAAAAGSPAAAAAVVAATELRRPARPGTHPPSPRG